VRESTWPTGQRPVQTGSRPRLPLTGIPAAPGPARGYPFTAETGRAGTSTLAAEHYLASPDAPAATLVAAALA